MHDISYVVQQSTILIVDDQAVNVHLLERILRQNGYSNIYTTTDPREVKDLYIDLQPDLIMLDLRMPFLDGYAVMEQLRQYMSKEEFLPIIVLTADIAPHAKRRALMAGASDFITKPFDIIEIMLRIHHMLERRIFYQELRLHNQRLEHKIFVRTRELEEAQLEILLRLARAAEFRDYDTGQHTQRVGQTTRLIAQQLSLSQNMVSLIGKAALLHDVGKIGISDKVLLKKGALTEEEREMMRAHTTIGADILAGSRFELLNLAQEIALSHHERWDGSGYPNRLKGEEIPLSGRIVAVANTFDALVHVRPYKVAWTIEEALEEIQQQRGHHFDPMVVDAFMQVQKNYNLDQISELTHAIEVNS